VILQSSGYQFDYTPRPGFDYSTNAIRLLQAKDYPDPLIRRARELLPKKTGPA
jgi:hypothetical protein